MPEVQNSIVWTLRDNVSAASRKLKGELDGLGVKAKGTTGIMGMLGNVTGGLITPQTAAMAGAFALAGGLVAATRAAIDEEQNVKRLDAALRANVDGFNGNTDAIEKTIAEREKLAFSDDELRDSLGTLVAATHDVDKAMAIQNTAMDLARFKHISLVDASEALTKVEAGRFKGLAALGIQLKAGATREEALAAVQKVAAGQAKAFGETTEGAMQSAGIAIQDVVEEIGTELLPAIKELAFFTRDVAVPAVGGLVSVIGAIGGGMAPGLQRMVDEQVAAAKAFDATREAAESTRLALHNAMDGTKRDAYDLRRELRKLTDQTADLIDTIYAPAVTQGKEAGLLQDIRDTEKALKAAKVAGDKLEIAKLRGELAGQKSDLVKTWEAEQKLGIKPISDGYDKWLAKQRHNLNLTEDELRVIRALQNSVAEAPGGHASGHPGNQRRASGGPVSGGGIYTVGEGGRSETLVMYPGGGGHVYADGGSRAGGSGGGSTIVHTTINLDGRTIARVVDQHQHAMLQRAAPTALRT